MTKTEKKPRKQRKERVDTPEATLGYLGRVVLGEVQAIDLIGRSFSGFANRREVVAGQVKSASVESEAIGINLEEDTFVTYVHAGGIVLLTRRHEGPKKNKRRGGKKRRKGEPEHVPLENFILE